MRIFIDIGHPAHVHYFKNFIKIMLKRGHVYFISARDKDIAHDLLKYYGMEFQSRHKGRYGFLGKAFYILEANYMLYKYARIFKPDILLSFGSPYAAQVSKILGKPHIAFDDTEHAKFEHMMYVPFSDAILTPNCFKKYLGKNQIYFDSYMELCYLHPNHFTPDSEINIKSKMGLELSDNYVIIRFVSWNASHDAGHIGISKNNKLKVVEEFSKYAKVFISSEQRLDGELEKYKFSLPSHEMHNAIKFASLVFGESATMASEAAILGTHAIYIDSVGRGYTKEQEREYKLVYNFSESKTGQAKAIDKGIELLNDKQSKKKANKKSELLISSKIDVTAFMVWFIENYPSSKEIMKENPEYQYNFK